MYGKEHSQIHPHSSDENNPHDGDGDSDGNGDGDGNVNHDHNDLFSLSGVCQDSASPSAGSSHSPKSPSAASNSGTDFAASFNLDLDDELATQEPIANLASLRDSQELISLIQNATFDDEKEQWTAEEFENFRNPPQFQSDIEDEHERLSFRVYLSLSNKSSQRSYEEIRRSIQECFPESKMLSFAQVRTHWLYEESSGCWLWRRSWNI